MAGYANGYAAKARPNEPKEEHEEEPNRRADWQRERDIRLEARRRRRMKQQQIDQQRAKEAEQRQEALDKHNKHKEAYVTYLRTELSRANRAAGRGPGRGTPKPGARARARPRPQPQPQTSTVQPPHQQGMVGDGGHQNLRHHHQVCRLVPTTTPTPTLTTNPNRNPDPQLLTLLVPNRNC